MLSIVAVGNKMPKWIDDGIMHYTKQMSNITLITVKNSTMQKEGEELLKHITKQDAYFVILDEKGEHFNSIEFARKINVWSAHKRIIFIIGGAFGIAPAVKQYANTLLSLSKATMPHSLARLVLIEQLYRAYTINNNHPYHKT